MAKLSLPLTLGPRPPIEITSPYAAGSSVPANAMGTPPFRTIITYCQRNKRENVNKGERKTFSSKYAIEQLEGGERDGGEEQTEDSQTPACR